VEAIESSGGLQFKLKVVAGLNRRAIFQALQNPVVVIAISELDEGGPQFLEIVEPADPEDLLSNQSLNVPFFSRKITSAGLLNSLEC
jgi:hypothetical protein